ncbi:MAG: lipid A export permease/ATP-binding protein MsbA [Gammaproteobacteria bacterium]|uniref:lipid A export permease/ATP-binding protein MsbA n=1 Tax=Pseudomaricurvus alcaniphilus TaxID=1166482 RepID=UPI00140DDF92|nr:lipid A export permease/ATP-binding protein MsbA [Pseudomaricurvus alcaniphilus]MBR9911889.1 lipid A export permease/ATP-binding protein MsbA [Gammaproteobacteria bacterium]NHN36060.1 lipid A export permease/ATP-binding protein MsbA [Pseudomaricurvus alcaniphilus]
MPESPAPTTLTTYLRLLGYLRGLLTPFSLSIIGFLIFAASQPMLAKVMELIIEAIENKDTVARITLPLFSVGVFVIRGLGFFLGTYFNDYVGATVVRNIRVEIFDRLLLLPAEFYDRTTQGQLLHRISSGVNQIQAAVTTALKTIIREGLTVVCLLAYVFYLNWQLSAIFLLAAPLLAWMVTSTSKRFRKITRRNESALGEAMQVSKETIGNYSVVRGFGAEKYEMSRYAKALNVAYKSQLKIRRVQAMFSPVSQLVVAIAVAMIIFLLLDPAILAQNTTGELVGYLTAAALIPKPLRQLSGVGVTIQQGIIGAELIFAILDQRAEKDEGDYQAERIRGDIDIRDLTFHYPATDKRVLENISLHVNPGEMIALVGKSGSGKSTLSSLIYRLYEVDDGKIFIDGVDINRYKLANLREQIAIVSQHVALFNDTIRNNISYGVSTYSDAEIIAALEKAHALEFIEALPDKLNTEIGENGLKLSGGQRQRLAIARAFLKDAPILILDEATSSLDNESEAIITEGVEDLARSRTTFVIAHRLSTILRADRLIVLDHGKIVEQGTHAELIKNGGHYARLFESEQD